MMFYVRGRISCGRPCPFDPLVPGAWCTAGGRAFSSSPFSSSLRFRPKGWASGDSPDRSMSFSDYFFFVGCVCSSSSPFSTVFAPRPPPWCTDGQREMREMTRRALGVACSFTALWRALFIEHRACYVQTLRNKCGDTKSDVGDTPSTYLAHLRGCRLLNSPTHAVEGQGAGRNRRLTACSTAYNALLSSICVSISPCLAKASRRSSNQNKREGVKNFTKYSLVGTTPGTVDRMLQIQSLGPKCLHVFASIFRDRERCSTLLPVARHSSTIRVVARWHQFVSRVQEQVPRAQHGTASCIKKKTLNNQFFTKNMSGAWVDRSLRSTRQQPTPSSPQLRVESKV